LIMNLRTKLAITGVGVAVLMLLAFLTPAEPWSAEQRSRTSGNAGLATRAIRETALNFPDLPPRVAASFSRPWSRAACARDWLAAKLLRSFPDDVANGPCGHMAMSAGRGKTLAPRVLIGRR
jgi:hypothetical protein